MNLIWGGVVSLFPHWYIIAICMYVYGQTNVCKSASKFIPKRHKIDKNNGTVMKDYTPPKSDQREDVT